MVLLVYCLPFCHFGKQIHVTALPPAALQVCNGSSIHCAIELLSMVHDHAVHWDDQINDT